MCIRDRYKELKKEYDCKIINCYHLAPDFLLRRKEQGSLWKSLKVYTYNIIKGRFKWMRDMYEIADDFVLLSSTFKIDFQRIYRIPNGDKLSFIPNPLSFDRIISKDIILRKKKQVLIVSRLEEFPKNICSALRIWKQIESKVDDWNLILAGYGKDQQKILNYANKLQLRHFEFVGKTDNPQSLYAESSLFMMTSLSEGFGMTLTESLQSACIPLAFDNFSALHDILEDGVNGFIIPMEREDIYADKLISLIKNEKLRNAMAFDAMRSSCKFSIDVIGEQWMALLGANHTNC